MEDRGKAASATGDGAGASAPFWGIVLAAGSGRRFGGGKLTSPWRGGVLLDGALAAAFAAPVVRVVVVVGADENVEAAARRWASSRGQDSRLIVVDAPDHAEGMGASLRAGAAVAPDDCAGVFVFLGDMPLIPPGIGQALIALLAQGAAAAAPVHRGRRGHPILFAAELLPALRESRGDEGARGVLAKLGSRMALAPCNDAGVLTDVDRAQDAPD